MPSPPTKGTNPESIHPYRQYHWPLRLYCLHHHPESWRLRETDSRYPIHNRSPSVDQHLGAHRLETSQSLSFAPLGTLRDCIDSPSSLPKASEVIEAAGRKDHSILPV